jgi:hypothetical protein
MRATDKAAMLYARPRCMRACQQLHQLCTDEAEYVWVVTGLIVHKIFSPGEKTSCMALQEVK